MGKIIGTDIEKLSRSLMYILRNGIYWHIVGIAFIYFSWELWTVNYKIAYLTAFILSCFLSLFYPYMRKREEERLQQEYSALESRLSKWKFDIANFYSKFVALYGQCAGKCESESWEKLNTELSEYHTAIQNFSLK